MINIQVGVGILNKPFILIDPDDDEEVGEVVGAVIGWMLRRIGEDKRQEEKEVKH